MVEDVWVEVDLAALKHNLRQVRSLVGYGVRIMAVVKANGYGHGYIEPSRAFVEAGADALAVTRLEEGLKLREAGISLPVLLFAPIQPDNAEVAVEAGLDLTVTDLSLVRALSEAGKRIDRISRIHIKIDTGMGRLGVNHEEVVGFVESVNGVENIQIAGIYTHFAGASGKHAASARAQCDAFRVSLDGVKTTIEDHGLAHAANSAAILRLPQSHFDMVRPGTLLYGQYPSSDVPQTLDLADTWKLMVRICDIRSFAKGTRIGYGWEYTTKRQTRAAIVPVGYADGFTLVPDGPVYRQSALRFAARKMKRNPTMVLRGRTVPVIGRVGMQLTAIDVTDVEGVTVGDEVVVPALRIPTSALVRRVYVESGA